MVNPPADNATNTLVSLVYERGLQLHFGDAAALALLLFALTAVIVAVQLREDHAQMELVAPGLDPTLPGSLRYR